MENRCQRFIRTKSGIDRCYCKNTKLGLKVSKDISDGLLENKEALIEVEDLEKANNFARELRDLGVSVEIE